jgi:sugar transferase (PEP-CTERM/EpsH1 system associated)
MDGEILFLCHRVPFPPDRGDKIRAWRMAKALAKLAPVHIGTFADDDRDLECASALDQVARSWNVERRHGLRPAAVLKGLVTGQPLLVAVYDDAAMHRWVRRILAERPIAAVFAYSVQMAHFIPALPVGTRFIMDFVDYDSAKYTRYGTEGSGLMAWVHRREGKHLLAFEKAVAARADAGLFVTEAEARLFRDATGASNVLAVENGVDLAYFDPRADFEALPRGESPLIVFTGQMDYRPNVEAVVSFAERSLAAIRAVRPTTRFAIVGRNPTAAVRALASDGVIVTGGVADVRPWLAAADVVVAPLRIARGVQNKVLEAMAMARPVVASPEAAEGIDARHGAQLIVADARGEAGAVLDLLADPMRAADIGLAARARMRERYSWEMALAPLAEIVSGNRVPDGLASTLADVA